MNTVPLADVFEIGLDSNAANYAALTPLTFIERAAAVYPEHIAVVYGEVATGAPSSKRFFGVISARMACVQMR